MNSDQIIDLPLDFKNFTVLQRETINDNGSFLHAFLQHNYIFYNITDDDKQRDVQSKKELVLDLRKELADKLSEEIKNPNNLSEKITRYEALYGGKMEQLARSINEYAKGQYTERLRNDYPFSNEYHELISEIFKTDIYLWNIDDKCLCHDSTINSLLYKRRKSVLLGFSDGFYYSLALLEKDKSITTSFDSGHKFIKFLYQKIISEQSSEENARASSSEDESSEED